MKKAFLIFLIILCLLRYPHASFANYTEETKIDDCLCRLERILDERGHLSLDFPFQSLSCLRELLKEAVAGNADSQYRLGELLFQFFSESVNPYLEMAANQGHFYARCRIAHINFIRSENTSLREFDCLLDELKNRSDKNEITAKYYLGLYNLLCSILKWHEVSTCKDENIKAQLVKSEISFFNSAVSNFESAAKGQDIESQSYLFKISYVLGDFDKCMYWGEKLAKREIPAVQYYLAEFYEQGVICQKDYTKALFWYEKSASNFCIEAFIKIGMFYKNGLGTQKDLKKSFYFFNSAMKQNQKKAVYKNAGYDIGLLYLTGTEGIRNTQTAFNIFRESAIKGDDKSQFMLAKCYEEGIGVDKYDHFAKIWYEKAAEQGNEDAKRQLKKLKHHNETK